VSGAREAVIAGVADAELRDGRLVEPGTVLSAQAAVARDAVADAGLELGDVDGLLTAGSWGIPGPGVMPTLALAEYLGIAPRFVDSTHIGGSSFESHVAHAARSIEAGDCEVALIAYGSRQRSERSRKRAQSDGRENEQTTAHGSAALATRSESSAPGMTKRSLGRLMPRFSNL